MRAHFYLWCMDKWIKGMSRADIICWCDLCTVVIRLRARSVSPPPRYWTLIEPYGVAEDSFSGRIFHQTTWLRLMFLSSTLLARLQSRKKND